MGAKHRARLGADLRGVFAATSAAQARAAASACAAAWQAGHPQVAAKLETELEDCLACYAFPAAHRPPPPDHERPGTVQPGAQAPHAGGAHLPQPGRLLRLVTALAMEQSEEWVSGRRYLDLEPLWEARPQPRAQAAA